MVQSVDLISLTGIILLVRVAPTHLLQEDILGFLAKAMAA